MAKTDYKMIVGILLGLGIVSVLGIIILPIDSSQPQGIPPTPAFKYFYAGPTTNDNVTALNYSSYTNLTAGTGMTILADYDLNTITFSSVAGSISTLESLTNVTDDFCTTNQVRKAVASQWICADDITSSIDTLESLTNVTDTGCATGQVRKASAGNWICANDDNTGSITTLESLTNVTDVGCAAGQIISVIGTTWQCTTPTGGATTLNDLTDVTLTSPLYGHILQFKESTSQWINKLFRINTQTANNDFQIVGINNQTGAITRNQFSVNTLDAGYFSRLKSINNVTGQVTSETIDFIDTTTCAYNQRFKSNSNITGTVTCDTIDMVDTTTCSGTDKVSAINNITGVVTCTADSGGAGASGIPLPPKKWGELQPRTSSAAVDGLMVGCTFDATASFVYDTTDNSNAILSTTAITDGVNGGVHCKATNFNSFRGDQNAYMYAKWEENKITTNRIFIGFSSTATLLPNNVDTIVDSIDAAGLCIRLTDSVYQFCSNDGTGTGVYASLTTTEDTGVHYFEVYTTNSGVTWCGKLDGGTAVCSSTAADIPTTTDRLYTESSGETDGGATAILWTQYGMYIQNDK